MKNLIVAILGILLGYIVCAKEYKIKSPDGKVSLSVTVGEDISYAVNFNETKVVLPSFVSFTYKQAPPLGKNMEVISDKTLTVDETWKPILKRFETIRNNYNTIQLELKEVKYPQRLMNVEFKKL